MPRDLPDLAPAFGVLYATMGGLAAYRYREVTGRGVHIDVAEGEAGASYFYGPIDQLLFRGSPETAASSTEDATRYQYYECKDGKTITFMAIEQKFWANFCNAVERPDLIEERPGGGIESGSGESERRELAEIFRTKTKAEWVQLFIDHDIAGGPQNTLAELLDDPHFQARTPLVEYEDPRAGRMRVLGTPIKIAGQEFEAAPPPELGEHTDEILAALGYRSHSARRSVSNL